MLPKGPRPRGPIPSGRPAPPPAPQAPAARRSPRLPAALRPVLYAAAGAVLALAVILLYRAILPPPRPMTPRDVAASVEKILKERPPEPTAAARAYQTVRSSLVLISARGPAPLGMARTGAERDVTPGPREEMGSDVSIGTGIVVEERGTILTSLHVVQDAESIRVQFADGFETDASVAIARPENDLAVLQPAVIPEGLIPATLAGSGGLRVGDEVVAVGHPFGIRDSVSAGVISGLGRSFVSPRSGAQLRNLIQFDAAVNPGNSGGPLLDRNGEVVGIVTALLNPVGQEFFVGIGFAVTIEAATAALGIPPW